MKKNKNIKKKPEYIRLFLFTVFECFVDGEDEAILAVPLLLI